jgi:RNA polymerase sigma-70 factor (ECF subfamily)
MVELGADVVRRAVRGESDATIELMAQIRPRVLRYCRARLGVLGGAYTTADDVSQEVCLAVLQALPRYQDRGLPFVAFVYGIASHKVADARRKAAQASSVWPVATLPDRPDGAPGPEGQAVTADLSRRVQRLLGHLSDTQREIIVLRVAAGLSAEDVGAALGMSAAAVRMAQSRALARLRALVRESMGEVVAQ